MKKLYLFPALFLCLVLCTRVPAQTVERLQTFSGTNTDNFSYSTDPATYTVEKRIWGPVSEIGDLEPANGTHFFGGRDLANDEGGTGAGERATITFDAGEICHLTAAKFTFRYQAIGFDGPDEIGYVLYLDDFPAREVTVLDGGETSDTDGWQTATVSIPGTATRARLEIFIVQNGLSDHFGIDEVKLLRTATNGSCTPTCGVSIDPSNITYTCEALTSGSDPVTAIIPYTGVESGVVIAAGGTTGGDDPATDIDGKITVSGLTEGNNSTLVLSGGDCDLTVALQPEAGNCAQGDLLIEKILASPTAKEYVEIVSIASGMMDLQDYTIEDRTGNPLKLTTHPMQLAPGQSLVIDLGGNIPPEATCAYAAVNGLGLNDGGDDIVIRNANGQVVTQYTYGTEGGTGQTLVRTPASDPSGIFQPVADVSPCSGAAAVLPVELTGFTAVAHEKAIELHWQTAKEVMNDRFVVERSHDGRVFRSIGELPATRNPGEKNMYSFSDRHPSAGLNYYRLQQVDLDGSSTRYGPVAANFSMGEIQLSPTPADHTLYIQGDFDPSYPARIFDATGRQLLRLPVPARSVNVASFPPGIYYLQLRSADGPRSLRFIVR